MQCPVDGTQLVMSDRQGVEIDYCPQCRGVWLDRGELDKIIERSTNTSPEQSPKQMDHRDDDRSDGKRKKKNKFGGFLDEIFDF